MKNAPHAETGRQLVDYLLSAETETHMTKSAHMPLRPGVSVPATMTSTDKLRAFPMDYAKIAETMERIQPTLRAWVGM
jgi:ABC-type Fe3+ transport system substrate-binding protein